MRTGRAATGIGLLVAALFVLGSGAARAADDRIAIRVGADDRTCLVHVPDGIASGDSVPLLLSFHGSAWNAATMRDVTGFDAWADAEGFVVAYPDGSGPGDVHSWNAGSCCSFALDADVDDLGFIDRLLDELLVRYPIDPRRVYACGFSNGGMLVHRLGAVRAERFAAIAVVSGAIFPGERAPGIPMPTLLIHGTGDAIVPYDGGWGALRTLSGKTQPALSVAEAAGFWRANNGCDESPILENLRDAVVRRYEGCALGASVVLYTLAGGDHSWPTVTRREIDLPLEGADLDALLRLSGEDGSSGESALWDLLEEGIDASAVIWRFFESRRR